MDLTTLSTKTHTLSVCPAIIIGHHDAARICGERLVVIATTDVRGDDYGSFPAISVYFACGHTLAEMEAGLRHADEI